MANARITIDYVHLQYPDGGTGTGQYWTTDGNGNFDIEFDASREYVDHGFGMNLVVLAPDGYGVFGVNPPQLSRFTTDKTGLRYAIGKTVPLTVKLVRTGTEAFQYAELTVLTGISALPQWPYRYQVTNNAGATLNGVVAADLPTYVLVQKYTTASTGSLYYTKYDTITVARNMPGTITVTY